MSIKVYRTSDLIPIKIGDAVFKVSPLNTDQKRELTAALDKDRGQIVEDVMKRTRLLFKYSIKEISGVEYATGGSYIASFGDDGYLVDKCVDDFFNMDCKESLSTVLWSFVDQIRTKAIGPDGKILKGVEILAPEGAENIKK